MLKAAGCCGKDLNLHTKTKSYCLALVLHYRPALVCLHPIPCSMPLIGVFLFSNNLSIFGTDFLQRTSVLARVLCKRLSESGLPSTGKLYGVLQHFITLLGILRNVEESFHLTSRSLYMTYSRKPMKLQLFWKQCLWKSGPNTSTKVANFL